MNTLEKHSHECKLKMLPALEEQFFEVLSRGPQNTEMQNPEILLTMRKNSGRHGNWN